MSGAPGGPDAEALRLEADLIEMLQVSYDAVMNENEALHEGLRRSHRSFLDQQMYCRLWAAMCWITGCVAAVFLVLIIVAYT